MAGKLIFFGSIFTLFIVSVYLDQVRTNDKILKIKQFDEYNIDGVIRNISYNHRIIDMHLSEDTTLYVFRLDNKFPDDEKYTFEVIAQAGDRIVKHAHSDTIQLIKKNRTLYFSHWIPRD